MSLGEKAQYLAGGDSISPGGSPREEVIGNTQLMSAGRFDQLLETLAKVRSTATANWASGGVNPDEDAVGRLYTPIAVSAGVGSSFDIDLVDDGHGYDVNTGFIAGHCPPRAGEGTVDAAGYQLPQPACDWVINRANPDITIENIPFEDDGASEYNVGIACSVVPFRAEQNPRTGLYEFVEEGAVVGVSAIPLAVTYDMGLDETTLKFAESTLLGNNTTLAGRTAIGWYQDSSGRPLGDTATAIFIGTVTRTTENRLVVSGSFGQDPGAVSTDATDYRICVLGPAVWESPTATTDAGGVAHVAYGRSTGGGSWSMDVQNTFPTMHRLLEHLIEMTDPSVSDPDFVQYPTIGIRPNDNMANDTPLLTVYGDEAGSTPVFQVQKGGALTGGVASFASLEAFCENAPVGAVGAVASKSRGQAGIAIDGIAAENGEAWANCCDGRHMFTIEGENLGTGTYEEPHLRAYRRGDLAGGHVAEVNSFGGAGDVDTFDQICCNGDYVAFAYQSRPLGNPNNFNFVDLYTWNGDTETFTLEWRLETDMSIRSLVMDHEAVYFGGSAGTTDIASFGRIPFDAGTGGATLTNLAGNADWSANTLTPITSLACNNLGFVVGLGDESGGVSAELRVSSSGSLLEDYTAGAGNDWYWHTAAMDELFWYGVVADGSDTMYRVPLVNLPVGTIDLTTEAQVDSKALSNVPSAGADATRSYGYADVDSRFYVYPSAQNVVFVDKVNFAEILGAQSSGSERRGVCSDGDLVFAVGNVPESLPTADVMSLSRPARSRLWQRVSPADDTLPFAQLAIPVEF